MATFTSRVVSRAFPVTQSTVRRSMATMKSQGVVQRSETSTTVMISLACGALGLGYFISRDGFSPAEGMNKRSVGYTGPTKNVETAAPPPAVVETVEFDDTLTVEEEALLASIAGRIVGIETKVCGVDCADYKV